MRFQRDLSAAGEPSDSPPGPDHALGDLSAYRASASEQARTEDLLRMVPSEGPRALDVGARDGHFARRLAGRFQEVVALDLDQPQIDHPRIRNVGGDARSLKFDDDSFDFVLCAEVLEHIPSPGLEQACSELVRVCRGRLLIGVPYRQDIRFGRTTCLNCGTHNPPWGHVNSFDETRLRELFPSLQISRVSYVGCSRARTNALSRWLMDLAGNPYGTYSQAEPCIRCGCNLTPPRGPSLALKVINRVAFEVNTLQQRFLRNRPNWIHVLFRKMPPPDTGPNLHHGLQSQAPDPRP